MCTDQIKGDKWDGQRKHFMCDQIFFVVALASLEEPFVTDWLTYAFSNHPMCLFIWSETVTFKPSDYNKCSLDICSREFAHQEMCSAAMCTFPLHSVKHPIKR